MNGTWTDLTIAGKRADVYEPPGTPKPRFGILFLHNTANETLRGRDAFTKLLDELKLACVCPLAPDTWWTDRVWPPFDPRLTAERFVRDHVMPLFQERWGIGPRSVGLLGISMGGQGALRLALKHPRLFPAAAGIAPALDYHELYNAGTSLDELYDSKEQCRQDTALMHIHPHEHPPHLFFCVDPEDAEWYRGNDRLHEKFNALGVVHTLDLTTTGGGHTWAYFDRMAEPALRFLFEGLQKESRRLV